MLLCGTVNPFSRDTGSRSVGAAEFVMHSGKIAALSAQITGNMCLVINVQRQISTRTPGLTSPRRFGITLVFPTLMSATGSLSKSAKYRRVPGPFGDNNIFSYLLFCSHWRRRIYAAVYAFTL